MFPHSFMLSVAGLGFLPPPPQSAHVPTIWPHMGVPRARLARVCPGSIQKHQETESLEEKNLILLSWMTRNKKWISPRLVRNEMIIESSSWSLFAEKCTAPFPHHRSKVRVLIQFSCFLFFSWLVFNYVFFFSFSLSLDTFHVSCAFTIQQVSQIIFHFQACPLSWAE